MKYYFDEKRLVTYTSLDDISDRTKVTIDNSIDAKIYVDILERGEFWWKVRVYHYSYNPFSKKSELKVVVTHVATKPFFHFKIDEMEELFDGRFNIGDKIS